MAVALAHQNAVFVTATGANTIAVLTTGGASGSLASGEKAYIHALSNGTVTPPSAFTSVASGTTGSLNWYLFQWDGVVTGATSYSFSNSSNRMFLGLTSMSGATSTTVGSSQTANSTTVTAPSITPSGGGLIAALWVGELTTNGDSWQSVGGTDIYELSLATGQVPRTSGSASYYTATGGTPSGNKTATAATAGNNMGILVYFSDTPLTRGLVVGYMTLN